MYSRYAGKILKMAGKYPTFERNIFKSTKLRAFPRPSFADFATYLTVERVEEYNDHWIPYWLHCHMCEMEFDVVGKMETLADDINFITGKFFKNTFFYFQHFKLKLKL